MNGQTKNAGPGENSWVSCGIPANSGSGADFWTLWAASRDSRKCPCGEMVITGPCPVCGAVKQESRQS